MSRKSLNSFSNSQHQLQTTDMEIKWSTQAYTLCEIVRQFSLPLVVKFSKDDQIVRTTLPLPFDLSKPVLLHSLHEVNQRWAKNIPERTSTGSSSSIVRNEVVIPELYSGLFVHLHTDSPDEIRAFKNLETLLKSGANGFLSMYSITGYLFQVPGGTQTPKKTYKEGNIFYIENVCTGFTRFGSVSSISSARSMTTNRRFLQCLDRKGRKVYFLVSTPGLFVKVLQNPLEYRKLSLVTSDVVNKLPQRSTVKIVHGKQLRLKSSGFLSLLDSSKDKYILACAIDKEAHVLNQLPMLSQLTYQLALNNKNTLNTAPIRGALHLCETKGTDFIADIKIIIELNIFVAKQQEEPSKESEKARFEVSEDFLIKVKTDYVYV